MRRARTGPAIVGAALVAVLAAACTSGSGPKPGTTDSRPASTSPGGRQLGAATELVAKSSHPAPDPAAIGPAARAEQDFTVALLQHLGGDGKTNVSVSPASLATALAMLQNGAAGRTRTQIAAALRTSGLTTAQQNAGWQALTAAWSAAAKNRSVTLSSANSAWLQKGFPVKAPFLSALSSYYASGVWSVDYQHEMPAALQAINTWTKQQTDGKITKLFDKLDPSTVLVLANAVYFKASWTRPFSSKRTAPAPFTRASGTTVDTPFMNDRDGSEPAAVTPDYSAVQLPYRGGRFAALAIMPTKQTLSAFTAALSSERLAAVVSSLRTQPVDLSLPKFTTRSTLDLKGTLSALGMPQAFTDDADFSGITAQPVSVRKVVQRVYLAVREAGTEAAAATGSGIGITAVRPPGVRVTLNHPFLFLVRDVKTGAILFASQVVDPSAG